ncbi:DUF397 domain-containing protein [Nonomuraea fastidiosa]|uniref:DUF397 domain-containing protein n=1 Tax=Nonomuraea TaxID=83681 RepID=UPI00324D8AC3
MAQIKLNGQVDFISACDGGSCVEVARVRLIRDSKDPNGPVLVFTEAEWRAHVEAVKAGRYDEEADWFVTS